MKPFYENVFVLSVILKIELNCEQNVTLRTHYSFSALDMTMLLLVSGSFCFKNELTNGDAVSMCCASVEGFFSTDFQKHVKVSLFGLGMYHPSNVHFNSNLKSTEI